MFRVEVERDGKRVAIHLREQFAEGEKPARLSLSASRSEMATIANLINAAVEFSSEDETHAEFTLQTLKVTQ